MQPCKEKGPVHPAAALFIYLEIKKFVSYFPNFMDACAAASLAIGTLKGEQLT